MTCLIYSFVFNLQTSHSCELIYFFISKQILKWFIFSNANVYLTIHHRQVNTMYIIIEFTLVSVALK